MNEVTPSHMSEVSGREELSVTNSVRMLSQNDLGSTGCCGNSSDKGSPVYINGKEELFHSDTNGMGREHGYERKQCTSR